MSNLGSQIIYKQLLERHGRIRIPMIQRDYAQGRPSEEEVREDFLKALADALNKPADDPTLPLNLDFIYGSVEEEADKTTRFLPLDGQQRLTTLFFLHWYLAWKDQRWEEFRLMFRVNGHARFSYSVRPSSNEFFDALVFYEPAQQPGKVSKLSELIADQPWYFRSWRLDPTIQSALEMLDAIHRRFVASQGRFARIMCETQPAITFQLLDLNNFGLSDDLYIKMNARGKPLTPFETFKARYEQGLEKQFVGEYWTIGNAKFSISEFIARRMDTAWSDLFWSHRNRFTNLYDDAVMKVFRAVALISRNPESAAYEFDLLTLRSSIRPPSYSDFHSFGWLDKAFTTTLICLLEAWSSTGQTLAKQLPDLRYFNEASIFDKLIVNGVSSLSYGEIVQLVGYAAFVKAHESNPDPQAFQEWMRVVYNLSTNTSYDRLSDLQRSATGLLKLEPVAGDILGHFAMSDKPASGFNEQQVAEEKLKAQLIRQSKEWRPLIDRAEGHGYFRGQIEFLFAYCGVLEKSQSVPIAEWDSASHLSYQRSFSTYLQHAETMFDSQGLHSIGDFRWQRALLSLGNYLMPSGSRNDSFLVNRSTEQASWKRLLRGTGPGAAEARTILQKLWDRLEIGQPVAEQLDHLINSAKDLETWREAFVRSPKAIEFCDNRAIRKNSETELYLLKKSQMNGSHAELFTYSFYCNSVAPLAGDQKLRPLNLAAYQSVIGTDSEPHIWLWFLHQARRIDFRVTFRLGLFVLSVEGASLETIPALTEWLRQGPSFTVTETSMLNEFSPSDIEAALLKLAEIIANTPTST